MTWEWLVAVVALTGLAGYGKGFANGYNLAREHTRKEGQERLKRILGWEPAEETRHEEPAMIPHPDGEAVPVEAPKPPRHPIPEELEDPVPEVERPLREALDAMLDQDRPLNDALDSMLEQKDRVAVAEATKAAQEAKPQTKSEPESEVVEQP